MLSVAMKLMKKTIAYCLVIFLALYACEKDGKTSSPDDGIPSYYVDSENGNDENNGLSADSPWQTLDKVNAMEFTAGDQILFKAAAVWQGSLAPGGSGTSEKPIVIDMYGEGDKPRINAGGAYPQALLLENQDYWEVNNLELTNHGVTRQEFRYGVRVASWDYGVMNHIHLKNLYVHDVNGSLVKNRGEGQGIVWENGGSVTASYFDDLLIEDCHLVRTDRNGICGYSENYGRTNWFPSRNVVIRNNLLEDIGGDCIKPWGCDGALVEYNVVDGGRQRCDDFAAGIWPWSCDNTVIQYNEVSGIKGTRDGQGFDSDYNCNNTLFQYNYSHDNEGGFMLICTPAPSTWNVGCNGTIIRYNISQNDGARIFHIGGPVQNTMIYNNVIFIEENQDIQCFLYTSWEGWSNQTQIYNNIFYAEGTARYQYALSGNPDGTYNGIPGFGQSSNNIFENNVFFGNHIAPPIDNDNLADNPQFFAPGTGVDGFGSLTGYKVMNTSPCIGAGRVIENNGGLDFWGNPVPENENPDIGVYQKQ